MSITYHVAVCRIIMIKPIPTTTVYYNHIIAVAALPLYERLIAYAGVEVRDLENCLIFCN